MTEDARKDGDPGEPLPLPASLVSHDNQTLFDRMAAGDESALAVLYDRWGARIHSVAFWILQDADEAEDVVEETFWQAWRTVAQFDRQRAAGPTWLVMIARSRALDRLRRRRRTTERLAAAWAVEGVLDGARPTSAEHPGTHAEGMDRSKELATALAALPPEQRQVIEMAFFGGFTHAAIAARMALPLGTVKTRLRLAMQKLRQRLTLSHEESL